MEKTREINWGTSYRTAIYHKRSIDAPNNFGSMAVIPAVGRIYWQIPKNLSVH